MKYQKEIKKERHTKEQFDELNKIVNSIVLNDFESIIYLVVDQVRWAISNGRLNTSQKARCVHLHSINAIFYSYPPLYRRLSFLGKGFLLRCFQELSQTA